MASFSHIHSHSLVGALSLSVSANPGKLQHKRAKAADARKTSRTLGEAAEGAALSPPPGLEAPPGLSLPDGFTAPPGLAPPAGLVCSNSSHQWWLGKCPKENVLGSADFVESDAEDTSVGTGSIKGSGSSDHEETEPEAEEFQMKANAPCFVPSFVSELSMRLPSETTCRQQQAPLRTPLRKDAGLFVPMLSPHEATGMAWPVGPITMVDVPVPAFVCAKQVQQGGQCWPEQQRQQQRKRVDLLKKHTPNCA